MSKTVKNVMAAIDYIEEHLQEKPDLETVAGGLHYSKYHLHHMFTETVGLTMQTYIQRRRLTEAAKLLVCSERPILEIAQLAGYESQQAFADIFKQMYKKTPGQYRAEEEFYPLQLRYHLKENAADAGRERDWKKQMICAEPADIPEWMRLVRLVVDGFPHMDEEEYLERLRTAIESRRAWLLKDADTVIGAMVFDERTGSIDFLGVHPQYRRRGIAAAFCRKAMEELAGSQAVSITTFRAGDKADTGYRKALKQIGFAEAELLVEFGYPTQRFTLQKDAKGGSSDE